jgi:predicted DNA binding protein
MCLCERKKKRERKREREKSEKACERGSGKKKAFQCERHKEPSLIPTNRRHNAAVVVGRLREGKARGKLK